MRELIFEYDRTKARPKCPGCQKFYKLLDDVTADDEKNVVQLTPHKVRVNVKKEFMDEFEDKDIIAPDVIIPKAEPILKSMQADPTPKLKPEPELIAEPEPTPEPEPELIVEPEPTPEPELIAEPDKPKMGFLGRIKAGIKRLFR